jgi:hypothetical protein
MSAASKAVILALGAGSIEVAPSLQTHLGELFADKCELLHALFDRPTALIPRLMSDLAKMANTTTDVDTQRRLLGEAQ